MGTEVIFLDKTQPVAFTYIPYQTKGILILTFWEFLSAVDSRVFFPLKARSYHVRQVRLRHDLDLLDISS